jgi:DNA-binding NtrC family response regulator
MNETSKTVLIIDDEPAARSVLKEAFLKCEEFKFEVVAVESATQADMWLRSHKTDVVIVDLNLGRGIDGGLQWMQKQTLFSTCPDAVKIVVTGYPQRENLVRAMRLGAWDFIVKDSAYGAQAVRSAVPRLKALEEAKQLERFIFDEWLPKHERSLVQDYPEEYIAIDGKGNVVGHGVSIIALGESLPKEWLAVEPKPFILKIRGRDVQ